MDHIEASDSLLKRMQLMAKFIQEYHLEEFKTYWEQNWGGNATASDSMEFFVDDALVNDLVLMRKIYL